MNRIVAFMLACLIGSEPACFGQGYYYARPAGGGGGGGTPDVTETFEANEYDNTWTEENGAPNGNFSTAGLGLDGSECLFLNGNSGAVNAYVNITASNTLYVFFKFRFEDNPTAFRRILDIRNTGSSVLDLKTSTDSGGQLYFEGGGVTNVSADTTYYGWVEYNNATGNRRFYMSTTGTKPASPTIEHTAGSATAQANRLSLGTYAAGGGNIYFDTVKVSRTTAFGDNGTLP